MEEVALGASVVSIFVGLLAIWLALTFYHKGKSIDIKVTEALAGIQGQVGTTQELMGTHLSTLVSELAKAPRTTDKLSDILRQALAKIPATEPQAPPPTREDDTLHAALNTSHNLIARVALHASLESMELALHGNFLAQHLAGSLASGGILHGYVAWVAQRTFDSFQHAVESFQDFVRLNPSEAASCLPAYKATFGRRQGLRDRDGLQDLLNKPRGPLVLR